MHRFLTTTALALAGFTASTAIADTITVCASGCDHTSINAAIDAASDGDVIQLSAETYFEGDVIDTVGKAITLLGATDKGGNPVSILDGAESHRVLQCINQEGTDTTFENLVITNGYGPLEYLFGENFEPYHVGGGMGNSNGSSPKLVNCTFSNNSADYGGGMISNNESSPTLDNCMFTNNSADYYGGGMYDFVGSPALTNCTFSNNSAEFGGGMAITAGSPALTNCTFSYNSASAYGGGMYSDRSSPTLTNCMFCSNTESAIRGLWVDQGGNCLRNNCVDLDGDGLPDCGTDLELSVPDEYPSIALAIDAAAPGAVIDIAAGTHLSNATIDLLGKEVLLRGSNDSNGHPSTIIDGQGSGSVFRCISGEGPETILENLVIQNGSAEQGGGMYNDRSSPTLKNCTFTGNIATDSGGAMYNNYSFLALTDCTFTNNSSGDDGGAIMNDGGSSTLVDCAFTNNSAGLGGAILNASASMTLIGCAFTNNSSTGSAGVLFHDAGSLDLTNCTFTNNSADDKGGAISTSVSNPTLNFVLM